MSSVRFKTGSQKEIQAVALNKTGTQCIYQCFPPELVVVGGGGRGWWAYSGDYTAKTVTMPSGIDKRLWHRGGTLDVSARKLKKLCLQMGRKLNCRIP